MEWLVTSRPGQALLAGFALLVVAVLAVTSPWALVAALGAVGAIVGLGVVRSLRWENGQLRLLDSSIDALPPQPDERILFEDLVRQVRVAHGSGGRHTLLLNVKVRLTTHRIVLAPRALFRRNTYVVTHVIYGDAADPTLVGNEYSRALSTGYVSFRTRRGLVTVTKEGERRCVRIVPLATQGPIRALPELTLYTPRADDLVSAITW